MSRSQLWSHVHDLNVFLGMYFWFLSKIWQKLNFLYCTWVLNSRHWKKSFMFASTPCIWIIFDEVFNVKFGLKESSKDVIFENNWYFKYLSGTDFSRTIFDLLHVVQCCLCVCCFHVGLFVHCKLKNRNWITSKEF